MAVNVANTVSGYIEQNNKLPYVPLFREATEFQVLHVEPGCYPSKKLPNFSNVRNTYTTGKISVSSATGNNVDYEEPTISAVKFGVVNDYDQDQLDSTILTASQRMKINPEELPASVILMELGGAKLNEDNSSRIWRGDTSLDTSTDFNLIHRRFDGLAKQVTDAGITGDGAYTPTTAGGTTAPAALTDNNAISEVLDIIQAGESLIPALRTKPAGSAHLYMNPADFLTFMRNYFSYTNAIDRDTLQQAANQLKVDVIGTSTTVYSMPGLTGTTEMFWTRPMNFIVGTDFLGAVDKLEFYYSKDNDLHYLRGKYALTSLVRETAEVVRRTQA